MSSPSCFRVSLLLLLASCATTQGKAAVSEWIPFEGANGVIKFAVTVDGAPAEAMLDSGADMSVVDPGFAEKHDLVGAVGGSTGVAGAFGSDELRLAKDFVVAFVGSRGAEGAVPVRNAIVPERHIPVDLLLGIQFFRGLILQIDYPNSRFRLMTRAAARISEQANTSVRVVQSHLEAAVEIAGTRGWLIFDTGNTSLTYVPRRMAESYGWLKGSKGAGTIHGRGVTQSAELDAYVVPSLKVGPYELVDVPIAVDQSGSPATLETGLIGAEILRHFVVTLDVERQLLHLYSP